ncbi:MAG: hypothetical protein M1823_005358 [Watsoniomyces obsoletus]|nr:MAG: hypothetical protein M1823_005358 [Watsoniomyces obsoletus]
MDSSTTPASMPAPHPPVNTHNGQPVCTPKYPPDYTLAPPLPRRSGALNVKDWLSDYFRHVAKTDLRRDAGRHRQAFAQRLRASAASGSVRKTARPPQNQDRPLGSFQREQLLDEAVRAIPSGRASKKLQRIKTNV